MHALLLVILAASAGCAAAPDGPAPPVAVATHPPAVVPPPVETIPPVEAAAPLTLREAVAAADLGWPPPDVNVHIDKSDRWLQVRSGDVVLVSWPVGLGGPLDDKVRMGDLATPEGTFRVVTRNDRSSFHLFLGISYPVTEDAERGLAAGLITPAQARAIREADRAGRVPPWETTLGGKIGIHGGGGGSDWTLGCIAVENEQIEQLWEVARHGTRVTIVQ